MVTLAILLVLALVFLVPTLLVGALGGGAILVVVGDAALAILVIVGIIKKLFFNKKDKD